MFKLLIRLSSLFGIVCPLTTFDFFMLRLFNFSFDFVVPAFLSLRAVFVVMSYKLHALFMGFGNKPVFFNKIICSII
jgi:hypothetical protein